MASNKDNLTIGMIDFVEENWATFVFRMEERGITEREVEETLELIRQEVQYE